MSEALVVPVPGVDDKPYWEACRQHRLVVQKCMECKRLRFFPSVGCPYCGGDRHDWVQVSGKGQVYSWIVVQPPVLPAFASKVPYNVIVVELDEGVRMVSALVECPNDQIRIGLRIEVVFERLTDEITLPKFRPAVLSS